MRHEKFVLLDGPSGGDGGRKEKVYLQVDETMNSLFPFRNNIHFREGRRSHGQGSNMNGVKGEGVTPPVASMEMLHAQTDLIESMQNFLMKYDYIPNNEKSIKLLLAEEKFLKIKQVVEEEQTQPEYLQELLQSLLTDLQILNEIQPLKQETSNLIQKDQEEKSTGELLAEERLQKANQALNGSQSPQEMRIQDLEIQKQQCLEEMKEWINDLGIREYQKEEINFDYRRKCEDKIYELKDKFNSLSIEIRKIMQEAEELRESEARARIQKIIIDDDDDLGFYAVHPNTIHTPVLQNVEPKDSFIMGDGYINTTPETETISVETLVSNPSESDDFSLGECNFFDIDDSYYEKSTSRLAPLAPISPEIVEACVDDDYDDDVYVDDCVDIEEDAVTHTTSQSVAGEKITTADYNCLKTFYCQEDKDELKR
ncbi:GTP-binding protein OBGC, chloroplastic [Tanacetum coccineum]